MANYLIQVGKCAGVYKTRFSTDSVSQASIFYEGLNVGRGWKKRVLDRDGKAIRQTVTVPDWDYCRRRR